MSELMSSNFITEDDITTCKNVNQEFIVTTRDKLELVLLKTRDALISQRDWVTPAGLIISFLTTLLTSEFEDKFGISKSIWNAIFIVATLACVFWLFRALYNVYRTKDYGSTEKIIERIKNVSN